MKNKIDSLRKKLKLDSHHATERFGIVVGVFGLSFALIMGGTISSAVSNNIEKTASTAIYTPTFTTSKTDLTGDVSGVYVSPDKKRALLLMDFGATGASSISADAKNYQTFLTGTDRELNDVALKTDVSGQFVMFGTTGYMGVVLDTKAEEGFPQQIMSLTVRANSELVYKEDQTRALREDLQDDNSFTEFDQWRVYMNPGAKDAEYSEALGSGKEPFSPQEVYYQLVVKEQEKEARKELNENLAKMQVGLAQIDEYTAQMAVAHVGGVKIVPPKVPVQIKGDKVTGEPKNADDPLTLKSDWTVPGGWDFDWRSGNVRDGYLKDLVPEGESYVTYLKSKASGEDSDEKRGTPGFNANDLTWKLSDGSSLTEDYTNTDEAMRPLTDVMTSLTQAYQSYYEDKVNYQTASYNTLINLEVALKNVDSGATTNSDKNAVLTY